MWRDMKAGLFLMPSHPPERDTYEAHEWDLNCIALADKLGFCEAWVGEHFTAPWEPNHAPDLLIAQALMRTQHIRLGVGVNLLPFHHPVELALRAAYLDHIAQGRFLFGVGSGGLPTDMELFNVDMEAGQHQEMTRESLDIILKVWKGEGPLEYQGKYWNVKIPDPKTWAVGTLRHFRRPFTTPHPPVAMASSSKTASTLKLAGERGFIPMSFMFNAIGLASHWAAVEEGARQAGNEPSSRKEWRIVRDVWIADTDDEAREGALTGMLGGVYREYLLPVWTLGADPLINTVKLDETMSHEDVTLEYLADNVWLVGSPDSVVRKLRDVYATAGGFGTVLVMVFDHGDRTDA